MPRETWQQPPAGPRVRPSAPDRTGATPGRSRRSLARVLFARGRLDQALSQLAACQQTAEESGGLGWAVEIGILSALVQEAQGNRAGALSELERALLLAEPEGYAQVFVDEGEPMAVLLRRAASRGIARANVRRLLDALARTAATQEPMARPGAHHLVEPLTEREMEVLRLMAAGLSNREIADELVLAMGTVKAHLHNVYGKLGVRGRTQAAARARELHLL